MAYTPTPAQNGRLSDSLSLTSIEDAPPKEKKPPDPNMANPRLLINRACIYERHLPGDAYITAHVERLQHGFYSSSSVSDKDAEHVDFLAIGFVFHSPHTLSHRFKSASIKVSVHGAREMSRSPLYPNGYPPGNPRFLMHAPRLIYGTVSPETMEWTFSLAGSLGISEMPVSASVIPSGSVNSRYRRYEMMRIQGSARTLKSQKGASFDVEAGEIVWSMEENNLQKSGLPREFTFVMLVQKPTVDSRPALSIEVEPVIDVWFGSYPSWMLNMSAYKPAPRRGVDFQQEVGQRFKPVDPVRGFNFAALESQFDDYISMPGRKFSRQMQIPVDPGFPETRPQQPYPGQYGSINPYQQQLQNKTNNLSLQNNDLSLQNNLLQTTLQQLWNNTQSQYQGQGQNRTQPQYQPPPRASTPTIIATAPNMTGLPTAEAATNTLNIRLLLDSPTPSHLPNLNHKMNTNGKTRSPRASPLAQRAESSKQSKPQPQSQLRNVPRPNLKTKDPSTDNDDVFMGEEASCGLEKVDDFGHSSSPTPQRQREIRRTQRPRSGITLEEMRDGIMDEEERNRRADSSLQLQLQTRAGRQSQSQALDQGACPTPEQRPQPCRRNSRASVGLGSGNAGGGSRSGNCVGYSHRQIMRMANSPLSTSLLAALAEK
ncbi:hypothetical protein PENARI_c014G07034 [Penicillium arizonense]|uniref:Uncharacterized protein n=1 Tax=Penicillium arizonense TaxID=1835702 RepID=A0A1F5LE16_PENAI|nr:hypothetical protein PENARI_c014G07034 [Penicillium arizonense]OGE51296.1 hypothetical protein PENARI_c014G07034 [Penicillium arizonense]